MTPPLKATLISALVFPGGGHFYLKKHIVGVLLAGICWLVGIVDSFRLGRKQEQARHKTEPSQPG
jgi:TM2 domain-containing membrane protein YozV